MMKNKITNEDIVINMAAENWGVVTTKEIEAIGINSKTITRLVEKGKLKKASKGIYVLSSFDDKYYLNYVRCRKGVYSHESAMYLHGLIEEIDEIYITIPSHYNTRIIKNDKITFYYLIEPEHMVGIQEIKAPSGNTVYTYDLERTICDLFIVRKREHKKLELEYAEKLIEICLLENIDISKLYEYAEKLNIYEQMTKYMEKRNGRKKNI